jgi:hypothetical protein
VTTREDFAHLGRADLIDADYLDRLWTLEAARRELHQSVADRPIRNRISDSYLYEAIRAANKALDAMYAEAA